MIKWNNIPEVELPIRLSPSAMSNYATCPAKFAYSRSYKTLDEDMPDYFKHGLLVHEYLEGTRVDIPEDARKVADKISAMETGLGLDIVHRELTQTFPLLNGAVQFTRRIDGLGYDRDGHPVLLDYKTASRKWDVVNVGTEVLAPQALTWQSIGYLIPPLQLPEGWEAPWPKKIVYLIGPKYGKGQFFSAEYDETWEFEFLKRCRHILYACLRRQITKEVGWNCGRCNMQGVCFEVPGWQTAFEKR